MRRSSNRGRTFPSKNRQNTQPYRHGEQPGVSHGYGDGGGGAYGGHGHRGGWHAHHSARSSDSGGGRGGRGGVKRHPPHLKGRDIGLWYAAQSKNKTKERDVEQRPVLDVNFDRLKQVQMTLSAVRQAADSDVIELDDDDEVNVSNVFFDDADVDDDMIMYDESNVKSEPGTSDGTPHRGNDELTDLSNIGLLPAPEAIRLNASLLEDLKSKSDVPKYREMLDNRKHLPVYKMADTILNSVKKNQVTIISGETGSGKSTQVPQLILDERIKSSQAADTFIVCTQPRRISAISLAARVAEERAESLTKHTRGSVGYQIRLESCRPRNTGAIMYCTTGILMQWMVNDRELSRVSHVILDEVHERDVNCDFMLILLKNLLPKRPQLKVILMSATLNAHLFADYLDIPRDDVINVPGRLFPVQRYFMEDVFKKTGYSHNPIVKKKRPRGRNIDTEADSAHKLRMQADYQAISAAYGQSVAAQCMGYDDEKIDYDVITHMVRYLLTTTPSDESILIFVPGWQDIKIVRTQLQEDSVIWGHRPLIIALHSLLPFVDQMTVGSSQFKCIQVFDRPPSGIRKIVVATIVAETSITIDDIVHVIDTGRTKMSNMDRELNVQTLMVEWNSHANCSQRQGRAGRVRPGHCYHLVTRTRYNSMLAFHDPEMCRVRLDSLILRILLMKLGDPSSFLAQAPNPPEQELIDLSLHSLRCLGAIRHTQQHVSLTPLGHQLALFPIAPELAKMIILGATFRCLDPILTIASCLDYKDPFNTPIDKEREVAQCKRELADGANSDHLLWVKVVDTYRQMQDEQPNLVNQWAWTNFVNLSTLRHIGQLKQQYMQLLIRSNYVSNTDLLCDSHNLNSGSDRLLLAVVCAALYPNIAQTPPAKDGAAAGAVGGRPLVCSNKRFRRIEAHTCSVNKRVRSFPSRFVCYHKLVKNEFGVSMYDCSEASPLSLALFAGDMQIQPEGHSNRTALVLDNSIWFYTQPELVKLLTRIRRDLNIVLTENHWQDAQSVMPELMDQLGALFDDETIRYHNQYLHSA